MKILITGAGGMLGTDLAKSLGSRFEVIGVGRRDAPHLRVRYRKMDLLQSEAVAGLCEEEKPSLIFHAAAMTQVDSCELDREAALRGNLGITETIVSASNRSRSLLIFFSTDYVFDGKKNGEYLEEDPPNPLGVYGETKLLAENYIRQNAKRFVIFRISWLYGLRGRSFPRTILERARTERHFKIVCDQIGRPTYTEDISNFLLNVLSRNEKRLERHANQIFHLANEGTASWAEFGSFLLNQRYGGNSFQVDFVTSDQVKRPAKRPCNSVLSLGKSKAAFGLELRHWQEAAKDFLREYRQSESGSISSGVPCG